jgi:hypothetical protein
MISRVIKNIKKATISAIPSLITDGFVEPLLKSMTPRII